MPKIVCDVCITDAALVLPVAMSPAETGAVVDFWGVVRAMEGESQIAGIRYEAHATMAGHQLRAIADECLERFELNELLVHHRVGFVPVGEASLLVRIGSRHRAEAFRASAAIVDELKARVPIWKHPIQTSANSAVSVPA